MTVVTFTRSLHKVALLAGFLDFTCRGKCYGQSGKKFARDALANSIDICRIRGCDCRFVVRLCQRINPTVRCRQLGSRANECFGATPKRSERFRMLGQKLAFL